jgi:hypothetical protein
MLGGRGVRVLWTQPCVCCLIPAQKTTIDVFQFGISRLTPIHL